MPVLRYNTDNDLIWDAGFRELTFRGRWNVENKITARMMARSGFYYIGPENNVRCAYCRIIYRSFKNVINIYASHRKDQPKCDFHLGTAIPGLNDYMLKTDKEYREKTFKLFLYEWPDIKLVKHLAAEGFYYIGPDQEVCCAYCQKIFTSGIAINHPNCLKNLLKGVHFTDNQELEFMYYRERALIGILDHIPVEPKMSTIEARMQSFTAPGWLDYPSSKMICVDKIVESGFYYSQKKSRVLCFHCGLYAKEWIINEDIDQFHRRTALDCLFIRVKLAKFVIPDDCFLAINGKTLKKIRRQSRYICRKCRTNGAEILFMPCNHLCCCKSCTKSLQACPLCKQPIEGTIAVFL